MRFSVAAFAALVLITSCGDKTTGSRFCYGDGLCVEPDGNLVDRDGNTACSATGTCGDIRRPGVARYRVHDLRLAGDPE